TAAMGAKPLGMLMGIHLPHGTDENFIKGLAEGMADCAKLSGTKVMGGDLGTQDELTICSVSVGSVKKEVCARRVGASQGDLICITGYLGDAACGLNLVFVGSKEHQHCEEYEKVLIKKALMPTPRTREGQIIAPHCSSMIDTSDGLALSLYELLRQNSVGMQLDKKSLPLSDALVACAEDNVLDMALYGAGDFELLFTVPQELISELMTEADFEIHVIGEVIEAKEVLIKTESGLERVDKRGWEIQV
ncbi:MAG: thiamine-phosphate kinase, partial [Methermicoccaceae archaeon]